MRMEKLLSIYKNSIITDVGKQSISAGTTFDDIRTEALRKVRYEILWEAQRELERQISNEGTVAAAEALDKAIDTLKSLRDER